MSEDAYTKKQLKALKEERDVIKERYVSGEISKKDYKAQLAKNAFLVEQAKERNPDDRDKSRGRVFERRRDVFDD